MIQGDHIIAATGQPTDHPRAGQQKNRRPTRSQDHPLESEARRAAAPAAVSASAPAGQGHQPANEKDRPGPRQGSVQGGPRWARDGSGEAQGPPARGLPFSPTVLWCPLPTYARGEGPRVNCAGRDGTPAIRHGKTASKIHRLRKRRPVKG